MITKKYYPDILHVPYTTTNESLSSIVTGLGLKPDDDVLSICGSGDQPLAILEYAKLVTTLDNNYEQIKYMNYRISLLENKLYNEFRNSFMSAKLEKNPKSYQSIYLRSEKYLRLSNYFNNSRLEKIRARLTNLTIKNADIFSYDIAQKKHNKVYLSNAAFYGNTAKPAVINFLERIPSGTKIYFTEEKHVYEYLRLQNNSRSFKEDAKLTQKAKQFNKISFWHPVVLEKVDLNKQY